MFSSLIDIFVKIIETGGYAGVTFLMALESMVAPVPSEGVMPFAGFLWFEGKMSFGAIVFFSTLGSVIGSLISYYIGFYGGEPFVNKYGKYVLLNPKHLEQTNKFFEKFGGKTVFVGRFIPVVRHLISIPAGVAKMNVFRFTIDTALGAALWNAFSAYLGYILGENWLQIRKYTEYLDIVLVLAILATVAYWIHKRHNHPA